MERHAKCVDLLWSLILIVPWIKHMEMLLTCFVNNLKTSGNHCEKHRKTRTPIELWIRVVFFSYFFHCIVETCWKSKRSCGDSELVGTMAWYFLCSMAKSLTLSSSSSCFLTSFSRIVRQLCSHPETWPLQHVRPANCVKGATHKKPARPVRKFISSCKKNNLKGEAPLPWNNIVQVS